MEWMDEWNAALPSAASRRRRRFRVVAVRWAQCHSRRLLEIVKQVPRVEVQTFEKQVNKHEMPYVEESTAMPQVLIKDQVEAQIFEKQVNTHEAQYVEKLTEKPRFPSRGKLPKSL